MTHTYRAQYFHIIWATKNRINLIHDEIKTQLYSYIGAIIKNQNNRLLCIGGMPDHVHLLISFNSLDKFSSLIRDVKSKSSLWIRNGFTQYPEFCWQEGYASFSVSYSSLEQVMSYIRNQEEHHKKFNFDDEYLGLLKKHRIDFDNRFVLG